MKEHFEGATPPQESLEELQYQEKKALEEHEHLRKASENNPKDSELRVSVDKAYDKWHEIKRKIEELNQPEELIRELNESTEKEIENAIENRKENPDTKKVLGIFRAYRDKINEIARDMAKLYKE